MSEESEDFEDKKEEETKKNLVSENGWKKIYKTFEFLILFILIILKTFLYRIILKDLKIKKEGGVIK